MNFQSVENRCTQICSCACRIIRDVYESRCLTNGNEIIALHPIIEVWLRYNQEPHFWDLIQSVLDYLQQVWIYMINYLMDYREYGHNGYDGYHSYYGNAVYKLSTNNFVKILN